MFVLYSTRSALYLMEESVGQVSLTSRLARATRFDTKVKALAFREQAFRVESSRKLFVPLSVDVKNKISTKQSESHEHESKPEGAVLSPEKSQQRNTE